MNEKACLMPDVIWRVGLCQIGVLNSHSLLPKQKNWRDSDDMDDKCDYVDDGDDLGVIHLLVLLLVEGVWSCLSCELPLFP